MSGLADVLAKLYITVVIGGIKGLYPVAVRRVWVGGCACETIHNCCYRGDEGAIARPLEFGSSEKGNRKGNKHSITISQPGLFMLRSFKSQPDKVINL